MTKQVSNHAAVSKLLRKFCKDNNIPVKSIRSKTYTGGSSVYVVLKNANQDQYELVKNEADRYEYGHFDGMNDMYVASNVNNDIPQVKFTFVDIEFEDEYRQKALDLLHELYEYRFGSVPKCYKDIDHNTVDYCGYYVNRSIHDVLYKIENDYNKDVLAKFWES